MTPSAIERVFGRTRLDMAGGKYVEVIRESAEPGERRQYAKRFLKTSDGDFRAWTAREQRILGRLNALGLTRVVSLATAIPGRAADPRAVRTFDAGVTVDHWRRLMPVMREGRSSRHVFRDCAHWWALAHHLLVSLRSLHEVGLVHLDIKPENVCIPTLPASFDPLQTDQLLVADFERLALIDFAFALDPLEPLATALPIAMQEEFRYQSPRLLKALLAAREGDLRPTHLLDWRCDLYSLAALLKRFLPSQERVGLSALAEGWSEDRFLQAKVLILAIRDAHDRTRAPSLPHGPLIDLSADVLAERGIAASLEHGWRLLPEDLAHDSAATAAASSLASSASAPRLSAGKAVDKSDRDIAAATLPAGAGDTSMGSIDRRGPSARGGSAPQPSSNAGSAKAEVALTMGRHRVPAMPALAVAVLIAVVVLRLAIGEIEPPLAAAASRSRPQPQTTVTAAAAPPAAPTIAFPDNLSSIDSQHREKGNEPATQAPGDAADNATTQEATSAPTPAATRAVAPPATRAATPMAPSNANAANAATAATAMAPTAPSTSTSLSKSPSPSRFAPTQTAAVRPTDAPGPIPAMTSDVPVAVEQVLAVAADSFERDSDRKIVEATRALGREAQPWKQSSEKSGAAEARRLNDAARSAYWMHGESAQALALQLRAAELSPQDPEIVGNLAFYHLKTMPRQPEEARRLALHALTMSSARSGTTRQEDWATFASASALTGHGEQARNALLVFLAVSKDVNRACRSAIAGFTNYGEAMRSPVEAMLDRVHARGTAKGAPDCERPAFLAAR